MSVASPLTQPSIRWHVTKNDILPTWFGLERRVLTLEEIISHQRSIKQLNSAFDGHRAYHAAESQRREAYRPLPQRTQPSIDQPINLSLNQSTSGLGLNKKLYNFTETKRDDDDYKYSSSDPMDSPYKSEMSPSINQSFENSRSVMVNQVDISYMSNDNDVLDSKARLSKQSEFDPLHQSISYEHIKTDSTIIVPAAVIVEDEQAHSAHPLNHDHHSDHTIHTIQPVALPLDTSLIDDQSASKSNDQMLVANENLVEADQATVLGAVEIELPIAEPVNAIHTHASDMPLVDTALQLDEDNFAPPRARAHVEYASVDAFAHLGSAEPVETQTRSAPQTSPQIKSRTLQLADLHEQIIAQEHAAALGVDPATIKRSPVVSVQPTPQSTDMALLNLAPESHVARMTRLHDEEIAAEAQRKVHQDALFSGQLRHDVDARGVAAPAAVSRVAEMKRLHDEEIAAEQQRKAHQDALFSGQLHAERRSAVAPVAAAGMSSRIAEMKRLHEEAAIAEAAAKAKQDALFSGQLKHATSQQITPVNQSSSRIAEMKRMHEEAAQAEAAAKAKQDALFSGQLTLNQQTYQRVVAANVVTIPLNDNAPEPINSQPMYNEPEQTIEQPAAHIMNVDSQPMDISDSFDNLNEQSVAAIPVIESHAIEPAEPVQPVKKLRVSDMARLHDEEIAAEKERKAHQDALFSGQLHSERSGSSQIAQNEMATRITEMKRLHEEAAIAEARAKANQDALFSGQLKRKSTDNISPARTQPASRIAEMKHLHEEAAIAEAEAKANQDALFSGQLKRNSTDNISPARTQPESRIAEMKRLHEEAAFAEAEAKAKQDALFSGQLKHASSEPRTQAMSDNIVHIPLDNEPVNAVSEPVVQQRQPTPTAAKGKSNRKKNRR